MRQKISTILDASLFRQVKLESVTQDMSISEIIAAALREYLKSRGRRPKGSGVVAETWGALAMDKGRVKRLLEGEESLLDS